jgi:hypothetical protein
MTGERAGAAAPIEPARIDQITDEAHLAADDPRRFGEQRRRNFYGWFTGSIDPAPFKDAKEMLGELTSQLICWSLGNLSGGRRSWRLQLAAAPHRVGDSHMQNNSVMLPLLWHPIEGQITRLRSHAMLAAARNVERRR